MTFMRINMKKVPTLQKVKHQRFGIVGVKSGYKELLKKFTRLEYI